MQNDYLKSLPAKERRVILNEQAAKIEEGHYFKPLTPEEVDIKQEDFAKTSIKINELEEKKKDAAAEFKAQIDPLAIQAKEMLNEIKTKQRKCYGLLYHLPNFEDQIMETIDENGDIVNTRRLRPDEKQGNVFHLGVASGE